MREDDFIVSKTDEKGRITYANRIFMEFAGYSEKELLGKQHNIVRHPGMPRAVYQFMWDTIQRGDEFFGYVKNMAKDGSFYWTFANVTPTCGESGQIIGFYSVRRKPGTEAISTMNELYAEMRAAEERAGAKDAIAASMPLLAERYAHIEEGYQQYVLSL